MWYRLLRNCSARDPERLGEAPLQPRFALAPDGEHTLVFGEDTGPRRPRADSAVSSAPAKCPKCKRRAAAASSWHPRNRSDPPRLRRGVLVLARTLAARGTIAPDRGRVLVPNVSGEPPRSASPLPTRRPSERGEDASSWRTLARRHCPLREGDSPSHEHPKRGSLGRSWTRLLPGAKEGNGNVAS
jgi:hypothetical protein